MEKLNRSIRKKWAKCRNCDAPRDKYPSSPTAAAREMGRVTLDSESKCNAASGAWLPGNQQEKASLKPRHLSAQGSSGY